MAERLLDEVKRVLDYRPQLRLVPLESLGQALATGVVGLKDLKYALPALLPFDLFTRLVAIRSRPGQP